MNFISYITKLYKNTISIHDPFFDIPVELQKKFIAKFDNPQNDIERSYNQYLCQKKGLNLFTNFICNFGSFFLYFYFLYIKKNDSIPKKTNKNSIFISTIDHYSSIPNSLHTEFGKVLQVSLSGFYLTKDDKIFIKKISRQHRLAFYFKTKCLLKIAIYRTVINTYKPKAILVNSEYSFTSSILTLFCKNNNTEHINIMHGEKMYYFRDSFFHFNRCYVWDKYFIDLFNQLRANCDKYIIEAPPSQAKWDLLTIKKEFDFTYYLGDEQKNLLITINNNLLKLEEKGFKIAIRPHPYYGDKKLIYQIFKNFFIEDTSRIDIQHSILQTNAVISLYSTVIRQAYTNNIDYILDNISNTERYKQVESLNYYFIDKHHKSLSDYIN